MIAGGEKAFAKDSFAIGNNFGTGTQKNGSNYGLCGGSYIWKYWRQNLGLLWRDFKSFIFCFNVWLWLTCLNTQFGFGDYRTQSYTMAIKIPNIKNECWNYLQCIIYLYNLL